MRVVLRLRAVSQIILSATNKTLAGWPILRVSETNHIFFRGLPMLDSQEQHSGGRARGDFADYEHSAHSFENEIHRLDSGGADVADGLSDNEGSVDEFESAALQENSGATLDVHHDAIEALIDYLQCVTHTNYKREEFDEKLDRAKYELQVENFRKSAHKGFLHDEIVRLRTIFGVTPGRFAVLTAIATGISSFFAYPFIVTGMADITMRGVDLLAVTLLPAIVFIGFSFVLNELMTKLYWWKHYGRGSAGLIRAKNNRSRNHDFLVNKVKNEQKIALTTARNKNPENGSNGALRMYLIFIVGYVLHKTVNRCYTRFEEDLHEIHIPAFQDAISKWRWRFFIAATAALIIFVTSDAETFRNNGVMHIVLATLVAPTFAGWIAFGLLHRAALRNDGRISKHLHYVKGLFSAKIPDEILTGFGEPISQRARFDFPNAYEYNTVEHYTPWLHETLEALKRHENETRP